MVARVSVLLVPCVLMACGGGGGGGDDDTATQLDFTDIPEEFLAASLRGTEDVTLPSDQTYIPLTATGVGTSILQGVGTRKSGPGEAVGASTSRIFFFGTRDAATDAVTATDTNRVLEDTDGDDLATTSIRYSSADFDPDPDNSDTQQLLHSPGRMSTAGTYDYALLFEWDREVIIGPGGRPTVTREGEGIFGVSTAPSDMPDMGTATYTGDHVVISRSVGAPTGFDRGVATVDVDFLAGTVSATATTTAGGGDRIESLGMTITENGFFGGTQAIMSGSTDITERATGGTLGTDAGGIFYGPAGPNPAEVGGFIDIGGTTTSYSVFYLAK